MIENEKDLINIIDMCLPTNFKVLDEYNDNSLIIKDRESDKVFSIKVEDITEQRKIGDKCTNTMFK